MICGFPGTGKSYMFDKQEEIGLKILDSDSSLFSWEYDESGNKTDIRNKEFPDNYIKHIKEVCKRGSTDIIFVSSHKAVRQALHHNMFCPLVVYPDISLKDEYIKKYSDRGNDNSFIKMMDNNWDEFIKEIEENESNKFKLKSGEYMTDIPLMDTCIGTLIDYNKMRFHMVYQNKNMDNNIPRQYITRCCMCRCKIDNWQNYYTNNVRDLCVGCQIEISNYNKNNCSSNESC